MKQLSFCGIATAVMLCVSMVSFAKGAVRTETRLQGAVFDEIEAATAVNVTLVPDTKTYVEVTGTDEELRWTYTKLDGKTLEVYVDSDDSFRGRSNNLNDYAATVVVHYTTIEAIEASSAASVKSEKVLTAGKIELEASSAANIALEVKADYVSADASSAANITVSGTCNKLEVDASSAADVKLFELSCKTAKADVSSGASIEVNVSESLRADASSGGSIVYKGAPARVSKDASSGGSIVERK